MTTYNTGDFDYELPPAHIAQEPVEPRDASRLMVIHRDSGLIEHRIFREIGAYLRPGDLLVANDSRVIPARLYGNKEKTGGRVEILLLEPLPDGTWRALVGGKAIRRGTRITISDTGSARKQSAREGGSSPLTTAEVIELESGPERILRFQPPIEPLLDRLGHIPLPPYIHYDLQDPERYQTVYSRISGSAAAPTAGLHFTPDLLLSLRRQGIDFAFVTLHVGLDTFKPVTVADPTHHHIHSEWIEMRPEVAAQINRTRLAGGRIIAVGTTAARVLESAAQRALDLSDANCAQQQQSANDPPACPWQTVSAFQGHTSLFILPGHRFRAVDALITNFHLPRSTLLMLVSAFAGRDLILHAYRTAIQEHYRFYSFGDATLIL
ncbi:MAG: tRNA preQ1(34) S-adenosylmethionine ribosyltransferase-isomerase QueA [Chloroflexi bacterium]|nr:tRNA preQ1(34) S-adenosylmethionine ribosyltransferase-isomerase QueA [Chloroflexota bacterium]